MEDVKVNSGIWPHLSLGYSPQNNYQLPTEDVLGSGWQIDNIFQTC